MIIRTDRNRRAFITCNLLSWAFFWIKFSLPKQGSDDTWCRHRAFNPFTCFPTAAKPDEKEEVTTVSGKVDADKGEKKTKEGKKEGKGAKEGKGDEKDASTKKKGEKGASKKEDGEGKGKKSGEKGEKKEKEEKGEKGGKGGVKGGAKKAQKWTLPSTDKQWNRLFHIFHYKHFRHFFFSKMKFVSYLK